MRGIIAWTLLLFLAAEGVESSGFFISAPNVFHRGVKEKIFVQKGHLKCPITLFLEDETSNNLVSETKSCECSSEKDIETVELMIDWDLWAPLAKNDGKPPYVMLVAKSPSLTTRQLTRVLVSKHRGYIFIQTHQPIYDLTQQVSYRVFTLDHNLRPTEERFLLSVYNPDGNRIMKVLRSAEGGIYKRSFHIPSVSKTGTWNITAHYEGDEDNPAFREFKVEKFVLPSFGVNIKMGQRYILLGTEHLTFDISAMYSYGEVVQGAYHCHFGVAEKDGSQKYKKPDLIKGLERAGSIQDGAATVSVESAQIDQMLQTHMKKSLDDLKTKGEQLYVKVFVTNIKSGEIQETDVYLPVLAHKYVMDLSKTRSHYIPGYPLDVVVYMRLPNGSPAADLPVKIDLQASSEKSWEGTTNQEGAVSATFSIVTPGAEIAVEVTADSLQKTKTIKRISSQSNSHLYMTFTHKIYSVNDVLTVTFNTINAPRDGSMYYMVLSRGVILDQRSLPMGISVRLLLPITHQMVPSFRLVGYYHNQNGGIVTDSVWVEVRDECQIKVEVEHAGTFLPGKQAPLRFKLHGQSARVALLAVDKAFYGLNADNRLTSKQVFSQMKSYDLGCSYSGGPDSVSMLVDAGLSFLPSYESKGRSDFGCTSASARQTRSVDLQQEMMSLKSSYNDTNLQDCCFQGFSLIPMRRTCEERVERVRLVKGSQACADAFLKCCNEGERLRHKKLREEAQNELGRTSTLEDIEQFFLETTNQYIRQYFPPSFAFKEFDVNDSKMYSLILPDSITTWEIQIVTLSAATGFCVVKPSDVKVFKKAFVSLRLPRSVKKYEQLSISPVIYNYGEESLDVAVHMDQTEGLCSPGSATNTHFVNITVQPQSSQFVSFSAVPMITGLIPIKIRLYDIENEWGTDAIEKNLNVQTEGLQRKEEKTYTVKLDGTNAKSISVDGTLPSDTVPDSSSNIFVSMEGNGFGNSHAKNFLSPEKVASLIQRPAGCVEQTMTGLVPTALAIRYLDMSNQWRDLPPNKRDDSLDKLEEGSLRILNHEGRESNGAYRSFRGVSYSNWVTSYVVKVLSLVAQRQVTTPGQQGRRARVIPLEGIRTSVSHLLSLKSSDGSFSDPNPVLHRDVLKGSDQGAATTSFITIALKRSVEFLDTERRNAAEARIASATKYLLSKTEDLRHPYAVAITAYCLALCLPKEQDLSAVWSRLQAMVTKAQNGCNFWTAENSQGNSEIALTIETTAYALLAAVEMGHMKWADETACWFTSQENYHGFFWSTQDTVIALEALAEYELMKQTSPEANIRAEFTTTTGRNDIVSLELENQKEKVETDLKRLMGQNINALLTGKGEAKLKVLKTYHMLQPKDDCAELSIKVTVEGKVKYTAKIIDNYDYYDYDTDEDKQDHVPQSAIEWFDMRTRHRRSLDHGSNRDSVVTYKVCVSHSLSNNLTGMAIADITLLSGFEVNIEDLETLKLPPEKYITHYELWHGRVVIYFNELYNHEECIEFDAVQRVAIGLLQPAPAVFYDYYEPNKVCTVFYSAPKRSTMVSKLCSEDVCQCAERPCHKLKETFKLQRNRRLTKSDRTLHACFSPRVDYAYIVNILNSSVQSNFELYRAGITEVLRSNGDMRVDEGAARVFAVRFHCKGRLDLGESYLIMGKDGATTDTDGMMQYLLESNTWVEKVPSEEECRKSVNRGTCRGFFQFTQDYKTDGCTQ